MQQKRVRGPRPDVFLQGNDQRLLSGLWSRIVLQSCFNLSAEGLNLFSPEPLVLNWIIPRVHFTLVEHPFHKGLEIEQNKAAVNASGQGPKMTNKEVGISLTFFIHVLC